MVNIGLNMAAYMGVRASRELETISHNLANASTAGFKRELLSHWQLVPPAAEAAPGWGSPGYVDVRSRDFSQGPLHETGNDTDLAILGEGFFKIQTPRGIRYTRNGSFTLNAESQLVTPEGYLVMGKNGPLTFDARDKKFAIDDQGGVHLDRNLADQVLVVKFPHPQDLRPEGRNLLVPGPEAGEEMEATTARVLQGHLEESNVDLVTEAVALLDTQRRYESYLKVLETFTTVDRKVVEEIGTQA